MQAENGECCGVIQKRLEKNSELYKNQNTWPGHHLVLLTANKSVDKKGVYGGEGGGTDP
jgi:hypothetical protein